MKKSLVSAMVAIILLMVLTGITFATTSSTLADDLYAKLSKYGMSNADKVRVERYLSENTVSDEIANKLMDKADEAVAVMDAAGETNYAKLTTEEKNKLKTIANEAASLLNLKIVYKTGYVEIYDASGKLIETVGETNGKLVYTGNNFNVVLATSVIAVIALVATTYGVKKIRTCKAN